jgi:hypothetical protein
LVALDQEVLTEQVVNDTLGTLLKYRDDIQHTQGAATRVIMQRLNGLI